MTFAHLPRCHAFNRLPRRVRCRCAATRSGMTVIHAFLPLCWPKTASHWISAHLGTPSRCRSRRFATIDPSARHTSAVYYSHRY